MPRIREVCMSRKVTHRYKQRSTKEEHPSEPEGVDTDTILGNMEEIMRLVKEMKRLSNKKGK